MREYTTFQPGDAVYLNEKGELVVIEKQEAKRPVIIDLQGNIVTTARYVGDETKMEVCDIEEIEK